MSNRFISFSLNAFYYGGNTSRILIGPNLIVCFYWDKFSHAFAISKTFRHVLKSHRLTRHIETLLQFHISAGISLECSNFNALDKCCKLHFQRDYPFNCFNFVYVFTPLAVSNAGLTELTEYLTVFIYFCFYSVLKHYV